MPNIINRDLKCNYFSPFVLVSRRSEYAEESRAFLRRGNGTI